MNSSINRIIVFTIFFIFSFLNFSTFAQKKDSIRIDSLAKFVEKLAIDTLKNTQIVKKKANFHFFEDVFSPVDSTKKKKLPKIAFYRSLILPSWGQATNRQYWVMPIVIGAAAGAIYSIKFNGNNYKLWHGYLQDAAKLGSVSVNVNNTDYTLTAAQITPIVNNYRKYRDLTYILFGIGWLVQAVQANVQAHLNTFDMSDNLSLRFEPSIQPTLFGSVAVGGSIKLYLK